MKCREDFEALVGSSQIYGVFLQVLAASQNLLLAARNLKANLKEPDQGTQ